MILLAAFDLSFPGECAVDRNRKGQRVAARQRRLFFVAHGTRGPFYPYQVGQRQRGLHIFEAPRVILQIVIHLAHEGMGILLAKTRQQIAADRFPVQGHPAIQGVGLRLRGVLPEQRRIDGHHLKIRQAIILRRQCQPQAQIQPIAIDLAQRQLDGLPRRLRSGRFIRGIGICLNLCRLGILPKLFTLQVPLGQAVDIGKHIAQHRQVFRPRRVDPVDPRQQHHAGRCPG